MKKRTLFASVLLACGLLAVGCASIPTVSEMFETSKLVGTATSMVCKNIKMDDAVKTEVIKIMNIADSCIPATNQSFVASWVPIAVSHSQKLVDAGKITEAQATIIVTAFTVVCKGVDYLFDVKFPEARMYEDLTAAAVHGFTTGFLSNFTPVAAFAASPLEAAEYDKAAFQYLTVTTVSLKN